MIQVGDKIRFLNAQGGGIVSKIINKEMVEVTDEDGFDVPTLIRECVVVEPAGQNKPQEQKIEDETFRFSQKNANICEEPEEKIEETPEGEAINALIAYLPMDPKAISSSAYECYLINDSNYYLSYTVASGNGGTFYCRAAGVIEPNTKIFIEEIKKEQLNDLELINVQLIAFKKGKAYSARPAYDLRLKINPVKFYKLHSFTENDYFHENALLFPIVKNNILAERFNISQNDIDNMINQKEAKPEQRNFSRKNQGVPEIIEVDLHIGQLLDNTNGLSNKDMLDYQMKTFNSVMTENIKRKGQKIVFIHGKGEGVLRKEILNELKHRYPNCISQDASFREYGFGATMVTIK